TCDGLDHDRVTDPFGCRQGLFFVLNQAFWSWRNRNPGFLGKSAAGGLVFQGIHGLGTGSNKPDIAILTNVREMGILRKEPIARMNGIHIRYFGGADDAIDPQIAFVTRSFTDTDSFVG